MSDVGTTLLTVAKTWLRITSSAYDDEITQTIDACVLDLTNGGVVNIDSSDTLIQQAIKLYLKAQFGYNDESDKFAKAYEFLKYSLELSEDYNTEAEEDDSTEEDDDS